MIAVLLLLATALRPVDAYNEGNRLYAAKDFNGAVSAYQAALRGGASAPALYNLGNAEFKSGRIGQAILAYRRARYLAPRDADIATNLAFARAYRADKTLGAPGPLALALYDALHVLSHRESALLAAFGVLLATLGLGVWIVRRSRLAVAAASVLAVAATFALATQLAWRAEIDARPAAIVVPQVSALSGPSDDAKEILLLHDGSEVAVREMRGDYVLAQLPGGGGGWIRRDAIERVFVAVPPAR